MKVPIEDILDALMLEESEPTYEALVRWSERYPEHGEALANFFATWAVQAELPQEVTVDEERLASISVSHALDILHRRNKPTSGTPKTESERPRLIAAMRAAGLSEEQLASRVQLDATIIEKLDLRRITTGIPRLCFEWLASVLGTAADRIEEMATGPPLVEASVRHKARRKPAAVTEDFADAISNSSLSDETKRFWLGAVAAERARSEE
jgi:hypothetical protein